MKSAVAPICRQCLGRLTGVTRTARRFNSSSSKTISQPTITPPKPSRRPSSLLPQSAKRNVSFGSQQPQAPPPKDKDEYYVTSLGPATPNTERALLQPNNLFHSFSESPSPEIRRRAAFIKQHAYCPHPSHQRTRVPDTPLDPENRKPLPEEAASPPAHVRFECPDCGIPVACCQEHWEDDFESHLEVCDTLRQINEDDHDLRSGRFFHEFDYPQGQRAEEFVLNMSNWDTFLYTRDFNAIDDARSMRQVTRLLTYPTTIASVLHELSPYSIKTGGRMTPEGLRSFSGMFGKQLSKDVDTDFL
jgi:splicing suppressor protein 51